ncbi:hypothetical protein B7486_04395 [cyanobacterium TDX16]|nr:hypothetical protein B7486_04395 [cyanobacterium TDX16]
MLLQFCLRAFLFIALIATGLSYAESERGEFLGQYRVVFIIGSVLLAGLVVLIDLNISRKSLQAISGVFFGLAVGLLIAYGTNEVLSALMKSFSPALFADGKEHPSIGITRVLIGLISCYFCVSFILQTKDDIRFVIPYVEFAKQIKGQRPIILDTSVIIDGRIVDICETGILDQRLIVPKFVLSELQAVADSSDKLKRNRGRRGLDVLNSLQSNKAIDVQVLDDHDMSADRSEPVDLKLLSLAQRMNGRVATNDYNLNKVAKVRGVQIININDLANAMKPIVLPGEAMSVKVVKAGEEQGQGVGYLEDGTMVVIEQGRAHIGEIVDLAVTSVLQTSAGRMIFGRVEGVSQPNRRRPSQQEA